MKLQPEFVICLCLLVANISSSTCSRNGIFWSWNIFRKKIDHYDKDVEEKAQLTTDEWIKKQKYSCEIHEVITDDGYVLVLHRIPKPGHQPILLVHGLLTSSLSFVMLGVENSLAFHLASSEFDVWLVNTRGTVYSRNHTTLKKEDPGFWKFSFHEIGLYDISATIDHVRNVTAFHQLIYIGHSQGATALFALCAMRPEYNDKILLMQALAPIVYLRNLASASPDTVKVLKNFLKIFSHGELLRKCSIKSTKIAECLELAADLLGPGQYNQSLDPIVLGSALAGGSVQEIDHFLQIHKSGDFVAYDYGLEGNRQVYGGRAEPDGYNLSKITLSVILHFGATDAIASTKAVHRLHKELPNVLGVYAVAAAKFNHFDFIWSPSLRSLVNANVLKACDEFLKGILKYRIE